MAYTPGVPRIARSQAKIMHPKNFGQASSEASHASAPRARVPGGGVGSAFGGGGEQGTGAAARPEAGSYNDPALTGQNFQTVHPTFLGIPVGDGWLTKNGEQQQSDSKGFQGFIQARQDALSRGMDMPSANRAGADAVGGTQAFAKLVMAHPDAMKMLQNVDSFNQYMKGAGSQSTQYMTDKAGHLVPIRTDNGVPNSDDIKAFNVSQDAARDQTQKDKLAGEKPQLVTTYGKDASGAPTQTTSVLKSDGQGGYTPVPVATGGLKPSGKEAEQSQLRTPSGIQGIPDQWNQSNTPNGKVSMKDVTQLTAGAAILRDLTDIQNASGSEGLGRGPVVNFGGKYFGTKGDGQQFTTAKENIRANAASFLGAGYKATTDNYMAAISNPNEAPDTIRLATAKMLQDVRSRVQTGATQLADKQQAPLDPSTEKTLESVGVFSNGYQTKDNLANADPTSVAQWKARSYPQAMSDTDKANIFNNAATNPSNDPLDNKMVADLATKETARAQAMRTQQAAGQAAAANQQQKNAPPSQTTPPPAPEPGAAPAPQGQQPQQPGATPAAQTPPAPGAPQQPPGAQPDPGTPAGAAEVAAPTSPFGPGGAGQGQPQPGMPGTNGATPLPPQNPLPGVSQTVQPNGNAPLPQATTPLTANPVAAQAQAQTAPEDEQGKEVPIQEAPSSGNQDFSGGSQ